MFSRSRTLGRFHGDSLSRAYVRAFGSKVAQRPLVFLGYGGVSKSSVAILANWGNRQILERLGASSVTVLDNVLTKEDEGQLKKWGFNPIRETLTRANYKQLLTPILQGDPKKGIAPAIVINLTTGVNSLDIVKLGQATGALVLDTSASEQWPEEEEETVRAKFAEAGANYSYRESYWEYARTLKPGTSTSLTAMGANPGIVSLFLKRLLAQIWAERNGGAKIPKGKSWASVAKDLGVRTIHIAERDTQQPKVPRIAGKEFTNTWSVDGFILEGVKQCADIGWGTHEKKLPPFGYEMERGSKVAIRIAQPSASVRCLSYVPTFGEQVACCVTHYETSSIATLLQEKDASGKVTYRPTVHYAYHPSDAALDSIAEVEKAGWNADLHATKRVYLPQELQPGGCDELGVLVCTNAKKDGTYWYGSTAYLEEALRVAPATQGTTVQVSAGVLSGALWLARNPNKGLCEPEHIEDYEEVLQEAAPFLGKLHGTRCSWTPRGGDPTNDDTWQFTNFQVPTFNPTAPRIHFWEDKGSWA